jgi:hypothetical protein
LSWTSIVLKSGNRFSATNDAKTNNWSKRTDSDFGLLAPGPAVDRLRRYNGRPAAACTQPYNAVQQPFRAPRLSSGQPDIRAEGSLMKIARMLAAASLVIASFGVATAANAQRYDGSTDHTQDRRDARDDRDRRDERNDRNDRDYRGDRGDRSDRYDNDRRRHYGWDRGEHRRWNRNDRRCRVVWRHHHRVRICR